MQSAKDQIKPPPIRSHAGKGRTAICGRAGASARIGPRRSSSASRNEREIDRIQRTEEAIVVATGAPREPECPAWVVLGVKVVEARGALHGEMYSGGTTSPRDAQADVAL